MTSFNIFRKQIALGLIIDSIKKFVLDKYFLYSLTTVVVLLFTWILLTASGWANELFLPGPVKVWQSFVSVSTEGYQGSTLIVHVYTSLLRILSAFSLSCLVGIPLGILMGASLIS